MRSLLLLPLLAGCVAPRYQASRVLEFTVPVTDVERIDCASHNGDITVTGDPAATEVALRAELSVRGFTQEEADANLQLLEVVREVSGGTLRVRGKYPAAELGDRVPSFRFTLRVPQRVALVLDSHNGDLTANEMHASAALSTHNGDIRGALTTNHVVATTHNGDVDLRLYGGGALDGEVRTHNGDVWLSVAEGFGARVAAATHNGSVKAPPRTTDASVGRRWFKCTIGDGRGKLVVDSHNGDVVFR